MMAVDSLHVAVPLIVPSGMSFQWLPSCRRACSAGAFAPRLAQHPAQRPCVQASCLERARPMAVAAFAGALAVSRSSAIGAFAGGLAASSAAPPGRRRPERQRGARRKARQKDAAPGRVESQSAHGGNAARSGFAAVPRSARRSRQCRHVRVLRTTGHARACRERTHDRPPRRRFQVRPSAPKNRGKGRGQSFVPRCSSRPASQQRQVDGAPSWGRWHRPTPRLAPGARPYGGALRRGEADAHVAARDHQDAAGQSPTGQPAIARQAPALHRARRRGP